MAPSVLRFVFSFGRSEDSADSDYGAGRFEAGPHAGIGPFVYAMTDSNPLRKPRGVIRKKSATRFDWQITAKLTICLPEPRPEAPKGRDGIGYGRVAGQLGSVVIASGVLAFDDPDADCNQVVGVPATEILERRAGA